MRRKDREITDFLRMTDIVQACDCCRLGLIDGQQAYIVPMNFGYDAADGQLTLYFHCAAEGKKLELLPSQTAVAFEMDTKHRLVTGDTGCRFSFLYQSVMGSGHVEVLSDLAEKSDGMQKIMAHYTGKTDWNFDAEVLKRTTVLKLSVNQWSCKEH